jgi:hypothetical protein
MATQKRFIAKNGVDNNSQTLTNVADPVNAQDVSTKAFSSNATNLASGTVAAARMPALSGDITTTTGSTATTLATVADSGAGTFKKISVDTKGRVTGTVAVAQADITGLLGAGSISNTMLANTAVANLSGTNTGDQTITLTGDVTGSGTGSFAATLANSGVTAGTYGSATLIPTVTVDAKGRVTSVTTNAVSAGTSVTITDDNATNATYYPTFATATSGTLSAVKVASTDLTFNPSTGQLNAVLFNATSDRNAKDNIQPIENALETVKQIQGVSFTWKSNGQKSFGYIAQDLEQIVPEVVSTDADGKKSVNYDATIAILLEAVKTLTAKVEALEAK